MNPARYFCLLLAVLPLCGFGSLFMWKMGARGHAVPLSKISSLYYKTSPDLQKVYVFYAIPGQIAVGAATSWGPGDGFRQSLTISFGAVKDTEKNRKKYGDGIHSDYKVGEEWVAEFDLNGFDPKTPHGEQIKVFYGIGRRDRNEPIPYRGTWFPKGTKVEPDGVGNSHRAGQ